MVPMFFMKPDMARALPQLSLLPGDMLQDVNSGSDYYWVHMCVTLAVVSIVPMLFGFYLMASGRIFIDLCYPGNRGASNALAVDVPSAEPVQAVAPKRDNEKKYMPPGA